MYKANNSEREYGSQNEEFVRLLLIYQKRIFGFILVMVPHYSDAEDLFQEVVMIMCRRFHEFQPGSNFLAWAIQIARYELCNIRKIKRRSRIQFSTDTVELLFDQTCRQSSSLDQRLTLLEECIKKLLVNSYNTVYQLVEK